MKTIKTKIIILIGLVCVAAMTTGCVDVGDKLEDVPQFVSMPADNEKVSTPTMTPDTEKFIDIYIEARDIFQYTSYESELKANESWYMALSYYENDQFNRAGNNWLDAAGLFLVAKEQNLEGKALFEKAYKIAPTEYYKEVCLLYIEIAQSDSKMMDYHNLAAMHAKKACDYYEKGDCSILGNYEKRDCILGSDEIMKQEKNLMRHDIELEIWNSLAEKIDNMGAW